MADPVDPYTLASAAAEALAAAVDVPQHDVALVLGSGWGPAADAIGTTDGTVTASDLPGFPPSTVAGHGGAIRSLDADGVRVLAYFGRVHGYEGNPVSAVVHNVRTAAASGCRAVILTNAAGGLREGMWPGQPVIEPGGRDLQHPAHLRGRPRTVRVRLLLSDERVHRGHTFFGCDAEK